MTQGIIYTVEPDGGLRRMTPASPDNEDRMQELVARYPELIADGDGDLLLIRREQAIHDSENGAGRWSVDHLFVTRDAIPVLVELKRASDTRLRREVVGQMLDYAANATAYWQAGRIAESFAQSLADTEASPDEVLAEFIGDREPRAFWEQVDSNFAAGRIKLVFVADAIPRELARIVEFLNEQMRADVRAVELRWFADEHGSITLSPRVIGETERAAAAKGTRVATSTEDEAVGLERQEFWSAFLQDLILDDAAQPRPRAAKQGYIAFTLPVPRGSSWLTVWRDIKRGDAGITLGWTRGEPGEQIGQKLVEDFALLADRLGGKAALKNIRGRLTIGEYDHFGDLQEPAVRNAAFGWLAERLNVWVNVLRPEVERLARDGQSGG